MATKTKAKRNRWQCPTCSNDNERADVSCRRCSNLSPYLSPDAHMLVVALEPDSETAQVWRELRGVKTSDVKLNEAVGEAFRRHYGDRCSTDHGPVTFLRDAGTWSVWFRRDSINAGEPPDLSGLTLLDAVRRLYSIPQASAEATSLNPSPGSSGAV